jgi:sporulation-control protein spo0M
MTFRFFWDVAPYSHVEVDRRFRGFRALMMEAVRTSETLVRFNVITRRYTP